MNKFNFNKLTPFKWFVLENFPFIEADFDALTEWQLFCKLGKEMNKIINSENTLGTQMENVTNAFIDLQNYVNNYFDNLDVQDEINNILNEMTTDGTLANIINQQLLGSINNQINENYTELNEKISQNTSNINGLNGQNIALENKVNSLASGSPAGVYDTLDALKQANPDHSKIYIVKSDNNWYYYNTTSSQWTAGGIYNGSIGNNSVKYINLNNNIIDDIYNSDKIIPLFKGFTDGTGNINNYKKGWYTHLTYCTLSWINNYFTELSKYAPKLLRFNFTPPNDYCFFYHDFTPDDCKTPKYILMWVNWSKNPSKRLDVAVSGGGDFKARGYIDDNKNSFSSNGLSGEIVYSIGDWHLIKISVIFTQISNYNDTYTYRFYIRPTSMQLNTNGYLDIIGLHVFNYNITFDKTFDTLDEKFKYIFGEDLYNKFNEKTKPTKNLLVLGDSITALGTSDRGWLKYFNEIQPINIIANTAVNGAVITDNDNTVLDGNPTSTNQDSNTLSNQVQKILNNNYQTPDFIVIAIGVNGGIYASESNVKNAWFDTNGDIIPLTNVNRKSYAGAYRYALQTLQNKYPNIPIFCCSPTQTKFSLRKPEEIVQWNVSLHNICNYNSCTVVDTNLCGICGVFETDGVGRNLIDGLHPNANGAKLIGEYNANIIKQYLN